MGCFFLPARNPSEFLCYRLTRRWQCTRNRLPLQGLRPLWQVWNLANGPIDSLGNSHGHPCHLSDNFCVGSVEELPDATGRERMRHEKELIALELTPGTRIAVAELDEIDGPFEFRSPLERMDLPESFVDLHKRSGPQHWPQRVILEADVAIVRMPDIQMLEYGNRYLAPNFDHSRKQVTVL